MSSTASACASPTPYYNGFVNALYPYSGNGSGAQANPVKFWGYVGCYTDFGLTTGQKGQQSFVSNTYNFGYGPAGSSVDYCASFCAARTNNNIMGLWNGGTCGCGGTLGGHVNYLQWGADLVGGNGLVPDAYCSQACVDNPTQACGGAMSPIDGRQQYVSVYAYGYRGTSTYDAGFTNYYNTICYVNGTTADGCPCPWPQYPPQANYQAGRTSVAKAQISPTYTCGDAVNQKINYPPPQSAYVTPTAAATCPAPAAITYGVSSTSTMSTTAAPTTTSTSTSE